MIRRPPRSPLFPYTPLFRSILRRLGNPQPTRRVPFHRDRLHHQRLGGHEAQLETVRQVDLLRDRKSTRLNSSHAQYLVCRLLLEKKKEEFISIKLVMTFWMV